MASACDFPTTSGTTHPPHSSMWYVAAAAAPTARSAMRMATTAPLRGLRRFFAFGSGARKSRGEPEGASPCAGISMVSPVRHAEAGGT